MPPNNDPFEIMHTGKRIFPERFWVQVREGMMYIAFRSGQDSKVFATSLVFGKRLGRAILKQIEEIELKTGVEIAGNLPDEPVKSPIQTGEDSKEK